MRGVEAMVDVHCHILPGFDDGAATLEDALAMARLAADSGVTDLVVTPHFPGEAASLRRLSKLMDRYELLQKALRRERIPLKLHLGAEILCLPETPRLAARKALPTIADTSYILTEFYFNVSAAYMNEILESLSNAGYIPVIAHPERYDAVQRAPKLAAYWFRRGFVLQLNKGSLLGYFGKRVQSTAIGLLEGGLVHLIATDAHSPHRRTTNMRHLRSWLQNRCNPEYVSLLLEENPARLLAGRKMVSAFSDDI